MCFAAQVLLRVHLTCGWFWGDFTSPLIPRGGLLPLHRRGCTEVAATLSASVRAASRVLSDKRFDIADNSPRTWGRSSRPMTSVSRGMHCR